MWRSASKSDRSRFHSGSWNVLYFFADEDFLRSVQLS